jgi:DNA-binding winged helix-turn-helix (wHTH) protein
MEPSPQRAGAPARGRLRTLLLAPDVPEVRRLARALRGAGADVIHTDTLERGEGGGPVADCDLAVLSLAGWGAEALELLAEACALAGRGGVANPPVLRVYGLEVDTGARAVRRGGRPVPLTAGEYEVLELLARVPGQVVSRREILEHLYGERGAPRSGNVVHAYISSLRAKIDKGFDTPLILTRWGEGYLLRGEAS